MDRKSLILTVVCIVVFAFVCLSYAGIINHDETFQVGDVNFKLPEGYRYVGINNQGYYKITNGLDSLYFLCYNDTDIKLHVADFLKICESKNRTVDLSNFTTEKGVFVYKTISSNHATHYWFVHDDKTYTVFTWNEKFKMDDDIARYLIDSVF